MVLVEDPQGATISAIVAEAAAQLAAQAPAARGQPTMVHVAAYAAGSEDAPAAGTAPDGQLALKPAAAAAKAAGPLWVSPAPFTVKMRLFCLPYAAGISENVFAKWVAWGRVDGGGGRQVGHVARHLCITAQSVYVARLALPPDCDIALASLPCPRRWSMMLPASIQVCPVELPGRGRREGEEGISDVRSLARALARHLPLADKPYAVFGTCLGAIVGYEVAREVEETRCAPMPTALFLAAVSPPHLYADAVAALYMKRPLRACGAGRSLRCWLGNKRSVGGACGARVLIQPPPTTRCRPRRAAANGRSAGQPTGLARHEPRRAAAHVRGRPLCGRGGAARQRPALCQGGAHGRQRHHDGGAVQVCACVCMC